MPVRSTCDKLAQIQFAPQLQHWAFPVLFLGFAVLAGIWPLHTWAPTGHVAAPTAGSMLLAGIVMKLGAYGSAACGDGLFPARLSNVEQLDRAPRRHWNCLRRRGRAPTKRSEICHWLFQRQSHGLCACSVSPPRTSSAFPARCCKCFLTASSAPCSSPLPGP